MTSSDAERPSLGVEWTSIGEPQERVGGSSSDVVAAGWGRSRRPGPRRRRGRRFWWCVGSVSTLLAVITILVAGWAIDHLTRTTALEQAHSAFNRGDCTGSLRNYAEADKGRVPWGSTAHSRHAERSERDQCGQIKVLSDTWDTGKLVQAAGGYAQFMVDNRDSPALISLDQLVMKSGNAQALLDGVPGKAACTAFESLRDTSMTLRAQLSKRPPRSRFVLGSLVLDNPVNLVACAWAFDKAGRTDEARALYSDAMHLKPSDTVMDEAIDGVARMNIRRAEADAYRLTFPAPGGVTVTGTLLSVIDIRNVTPYPLRISMSSLYLGMGGKKAVTFTIKGCKSCKDRQNPYLGCSSSGQVKEFTVPFGTYSAAIEPLWPSGIAAMRPFVGKVTVKEDSSYDIWLCT
jgi:hypothetical protein